MYFNIYYTNNGAGGYIKNKNLEKVGFWVNAILTTGGEITGIIDVEKDS